jgi:hypothetical protein
MVLFGKKRELDPLVPKVLGDRGTANLIRSGRTTDHNRPEFWMQMSDRPNAMRSRIEGTSEARAN